jgi:hypothetical protein
MGIQNSKSHSKTLTGDCSYHPIEIIISEQIIVEIGEKCSHP